MGKIKNTCLLLKQSISPEFKWEMDNRLNASLISFNSGDAEAILENISKIFDNQFDSSSINKASKQEKKLAKTLFGITKGQFLFTTNEDDLTLFGAWWPWGDNSKISLRIGIFTIQNGLIDDDEIKKSLTDWFAIV